ncbi:hypothetical protein ONZ45_g8009 [Pleurotus djamor]|nr:hypothetical protein ONZ45_g8009 [Pleurotus djamor]
MPPPDKPVDLEGTFSGIQSYFSNIEQSLAALSSQSLELSKAGPTIEDVEQQLQPLKKQIDAESVTLDKDIIALKETVRSDLKIQVIDALRDRIQSQVRLEVASQVKAQFDVQIRDYIPISLAEQVEQNKAQIEKVKCSRMNSEARRDNSGIQDTDLDEPFQVILMDNGERSDVWPADLRSLFAYEGSVYGSQHESIPVAHSLPTSGTDQELASRLTQHDLHQYHFPGHPQVPLSPPPSPPPILRESNGFSVEVVADIMDQVGDWELAKAVGVPTSLARPIEWAKASSTDHAILTGNIPLIRSSDPSQNPPTKVGAVAAVRFGYVHVLEFLLSHHHDIFLSVFAGDIIPIKASRHGRTSVLSWWKHGFQKHPDLIPPPKPGAISEAIDGASRNGQTVSLDWWLRSGLSFDYSEAALEHASAKNQVPVLEWWKQLNKTTGLPLKIGRVMDAASTAGHVAVLEWWATSQLDFKYDRYALHQASCHGKVEVLEWWLGSGLQLLFDQDALTGATRHNRADVLEWWDKSGLPIQYRMCDIEEALEDAIGGGERARAWWKRKGVDFHADDKEWMKLQHLNK